jgi:hypothetical protein
MTAYDRLRQHVLQCGRAFTIPQRRTRGYCIGQSLTQTYESCDKTVREFITHSTTNKILDDGSFIITPNAEKTFSAILDECLNQDPQPEELTVEQQQKQHDQDQSELTSILFPSYGTLTRERCGFKRSFERRPPLVCRINVDHNSVVSLALIRRRNTILGSYANKLPIMTINISRLLYTIEAFMFCDPGVCTGIDRRKFKKFKPNDDSRMPTVIESALDFYLRTDIESRPPNLPANRQFSDFLHRLRSTGYLGYIFALATRLNFNIDLLINDTTCVRYHRVEASTKQTKIGVGYLTVLVHRKRIHYAVASNEHYESQWYVKISAEPIVKSNADACREMSQNSTSSLSLYVDPIERLVTSLNAATDELKRKKQQQNHQHDLRYQEQTHASAVDFVRSLM